MDGTLLNFPRFVQQTTCPIEGLQITVGEGEVFNHVDTQEYMWDGDGDRQVRQTIHFETPFHALPLVAVGVSGIDASRAQNQRFHVKAENIMFWF